MLTGYTSSPRGTGSSASSSSSSSMALDRTNQFYQLVKEMDGSGTAAEAIAEHETGSSSGAASSSSTAAVAQFNKYANEIGVDLHQTQMKIQELGRREDSVHRSAANEDSFVVARSKGIFNDQSARINDFTADIKRDLDGLSQKIELLQQHASKSAESKQALAHTSGIVKTLQTRLMGLTKDFKDVLELRTKTLQQQDRRRNMYAFSSSNPFQQRGGTEMADAASFKGGPPSGFDIEGGREEQEQMLQGPGYLNARANAVQAVQRTIGELGQMFQKVSSMVYEQDEMIMRIDSDVDDTMGHLNEGQNQLLKYFHSISGNRSLILKIFAILICFVIFFVLFLA
ncbi:Syntaxin-5 [Perkinsus olseni]|uniref:Syntaxin-5 n=1 Tax=Perkinsus olseni TaxID=32597 RepID=A0A7J6MDP1_PEROL|nr:Syntaxin-5 [Perkinsus olseni]